VVARAPAPVPALPVFHQLLAPFPPALPRDANHAGACRRWPVSPPPREYPVEGSPVPGSRAPMAGPFPAPPQERIGPGPHPARWGRVGAQRLPGNGSWADNDGTTGGRHGFRNPGRQEAHKPVEAAAPGPRHLAGARAGCHYPAPVDNRSPPTLRRHGTDFPRGSHLLHHASLFPSFPPGCLLNLSQMALPAQRGIMQRTSGKGWRKCERMPELLKRAPTPGDCRGPPPP
jgi:hypothetical protein